VYSKVLINEFNPQSRDHIANRLKAKYGWQPTEFTDGGKPKIDEKVLGRLDYPEAKPLAELFLIEKRIGQIAEGTEAWLKHEKDGWIHHRLNPNGAVTGRATHSKINITQVPKVGIRYGKECRALFGLIEKPLRNRGPGTGGRTVSCTASDVAGLELRCLAHYMASLRQGRLWPCCH
jgi:DNA polymerase-1